MLITSLGFSQSQKYLQTMGTKIAALDTTRNPEALKEMAHSFERIATAEKTQWEPYYYASLGHINMAYMLVSNGTPDAAIIDPIADKAENLMLSAEALSAKNAEIFILKKMIASLRFMVDPMTRYMQFGPLAQQALDKAKALDPDNPRVYLLEGQDKFFTPEQFGGSKAEAKKLFEMAAKKFDIHKPASNIAPHWGRNTLTYFLAQVK
jgi:hypothetical protein